ncbi:MAG: hypothetical protein AAB484_01050 [Patescibacteria group bacterium]
MDPQFKTSFIPRKPIVAQAVGRSVSTSINLFSLLATTLFIVVIALSGGVFFYKSLIKKQIESNKVTLERAKGAFEPELIEQIIRLDTRIETSKKLLAGHLAITPFFDFLSTVTLSTVRFKDFSFSYLASDKINIEMKGQAQNYSSVALESDLLNSQKYLKNTIISDMALEPNGTVSFKILTTVDPSLVLYSFDISRSATQNENIENITETTTNP